MPSHYETLKPCVCGSRFITFCQFERTNKSIKWCHSDKHRDIWRTYVTRLLGQQCTKSELPSLTAFKYMWLNNICGFWNFDHSNCDMTCLADFKCLLVLAQTVHPDIRFLAGFLLTFIFGIDFLTAIETAWLWACRHVIDSSPWQPRVQTRFFFYICFCVRSFGCQFVCRFPTRRKRQRRHSQNQSYGRHVYP